MTKHILRFDSVCECEANEFELAHLLRGCMTAVVVLHTVKKGERVELKVRENVILSMCML